MADQSRQENRQESNRPLIPVGRTRGLLAAWHQTSREEEIRWRRGGMWSPVSVTLGWGRVATLAVLCKSATQNTLRAPSPIPQQRRGRWRGLSSLLHDHPYIPSGMGRDRSRNSGPCPFPDPSLQVPNTQPSVCVNNGIFPIPHINPIDHLWKLLLDPHLRNQ